MLQRTLQFRLGPVHFWCCEKPGRRNLRERTSTGHFDTTQETLYKTSVQPADRRPEPAGRPASCRACVYVCACVPRTAAAKPEANAAQE